MNISTKEKNLLKELESHENEWVAIVDKEKVVASGTSAKEVKDAAEKAGHTDARLLKVLPFDGSYAPSLV